MKQTPFGHIVGQDKLKNRLQFYLDCFAQGEVVPNLALIAPKGTGKTTAAEAMGVELHRISGMQKNCHVINCSTLKGVGAFVNQIVIPLLVDKQATLILDEASELPKAVTFFMLSMLQPNLQNRNHVIYDDYHFDIDFRQHTFILATSEAQSVFDALMDRCTRIELEEYCITDIQQIIAKQKVDIADATLAKVASVCRGNARSAVAIAKEVGRYQTAHPGKFNDKAWAQLSEILGLLPLGLSNMELTLLKALRNRPDGTSLTRLGACLGMTKESVQRDLELYPQKLGLMEITTGGRVLSPNGQKYLKALGL